MRNHKFSDRNGNLYSKHSFIFHFSLCSCNSWNIRQFWWKFIIFDFIFSERSLGGNWADKRPRFVTSSFKDFWNAVLNFSLFILLSAIGKALTYSLWVELIPRIEAYTASIKRNDHPNARLQHSIFQYLQNLWIHKLMSITESKITKNFPGMRRFLFV